MSNTALPPTGLLCDLIERPDLALIATRQPKFGWVFNDAAPNACQAGFQILVATRMETLARDAGDLWDSGVYDPAKVWVTDDRSLHVPYAGKPLASNRTYCWKVRTWNQRNEVSPYSEPQTFRTGRLANGHSTAGCRLVTTDLPPQRVVQVGPDRTFVDFGRAAFGTLRLTLTAATAGQTVRVCLGEVPDGPLALQRHPGGSRRYREIPLRLKRGTHSYLLAIPPDARNTNTKITPDTPVAIRIPEGLPEVLPFRYAEVCEHAEPVRRDQVRQVALHHPFNDDAARFVSSSRVLNDVWELCRYSMKATSFLGLYVDGDRERIPYEADAYINQLGHYCCDREYSMGRRTHEYLIRHSNWPTEWILFSVLMAWEDYVYTGDASSLAAFYPDLEAKALLALADEGGLISTATEKMTPDVVASVHLRRPPKDIVDWPPAERDGYDLRPVNTVVNAFHCRALVLLSRIAAALGKAEDAARYRHVAARATTALQARLFDPARGLFVDGEGSAHVSLHANLFPLAFGLVPAARVAGVATFLRGRGMACSVYGAQFLIEALYRAGDADTALALLTATGERSWAHMLYDVGSTMSLEAWDDRLKPNQDWNHAWGAAPANLIPRRLMGVRPLGPGFGRILIHPQPGSLGYADLTTPTVRGPVRVTVTQTPPRTFAVETETPGNTTAQVRLPRLGGPDATVLVDGRPVAAVPQGDWLVVDGIGSGRHTFVRAG